MKATRRRARSVDPLATPEAVRATVNQLREKCKGIVPESEKQLLQFLESVRHADRKSVVDTKRGRPSRWKREELFTVAGHLRTILERETLGRISLSSFVGQYLRILRYPSDVVEALSAGEINLMEAAQLARLTAARLECSASEARKQRRELMASHAAMQGSQNRLRARVKEILGETKEAEISAGAMSQVIERVDEMLEIDPSDTRHLFWEEMKRIFYAMREIEPEDLEEDVLSDFMRAMDEVSNVLYRIEKRAQQRRQQLRKDEG